MVTTPNPIWLGRLIAMRQNIASICMLAALTGCATRQALVVKESSDRRPITTPAGVVRINGIYVCRGLKRIGSAGGLGFWPFESPAIQLSFAEFLRFDDDGNASCWNAEEPATIGDARMFFREIKGKKWAVEGTYRVEGSDLSFVLTALTADGHSYAQTRYVGKVYKDHLALNIDHGTIFPLATRYNYREYDFVPDRE